MKKTLVPIMILTFFLGQPFPSWSQGFTKINVDNKFGTTSSGPITPKTPTGTTPTGTDMGDDENTIQWNGTDLDIKDMIKQIAALTGENFILDKNVSGKVNIISEQPLDKKMAYEAFLSALEINGFTVIRTPAGMLRIIKQPDSLNKPTDIYKQDGVLDEGAVSLHNTDKYITRIVQLNNISANEISQVISYMGSKSGKIVPYPTTNSLIITDAGSNIDHMLKLIKELDQEGPQETLEIIPIMNADAKDIAEKISEIYDKGDSSKSGAQTALINRRNRLRGGGSEMEDVQSISKIISDERTNSVIILGTKRSIAKVRALIAQLDRAISGVEGTIHVYYLKYAKAEDIAEVLSGLVQDASTSKTSASAAKSKTADAKTGAVQLEGGVKVTADESTNSLVVIASPKDFTTLVDKVISKLDILRPQVYLEAVIMSLDVQKSQTIGISGMGGFLNTLSKGLQILPFGSILPVTPESISSIAGAAGGFAGGVVSTQTSDFTLADGSTVTIPSVSGIIQALASDTDANVLSTPSILTLDNEKATIQVGQEVPVPSGTTVSSGVTTFNVTREDVGIILEITPQISENDSVRLQLKQEITGVFTSDPNLGPTLDKKEVETVVLAKNKQTIVIGGLIDDTATVSTQKVPLLGDIPVLGTLFRTRTVEKSKTNLIVFITPYIVRERKDFLAILKKKIEERNNYIDMNYGKSQQKFIRKSIEHHANDLLEFKCNMNPDSDPCVSSNYGQSTSYSVTQSEGKNNDYTPPKKVKYK